jgi:hypothetical protein
MAKVYFYGAKLPIATLSGWYEKGYKKVIFQLESRDSNSNRDEYFLIAYPINTDTKTVGEVFTLESTEQKVGVKDKLLIGNLPLYEDQIKKFLAEAGAVYILFTSKLPSTSTPKLKDYVIYHLQSMPVTVEALVEEELHPSPPAPPAD